MVHRAELGQTDDPKALIPGDIEAIFENARVLRDRATDIIASGEALKRIDTGSWRGKAHDAWATAHESEVPKWLDTGNGMSACAQVLEMYANVLGWAQRQALEATVLYQQGEQATQQAKAASDPAAAMAPATDPGETYRQAAREILDRARNQIHGIGDETAQSIRDLTAGAPQEEESTLSAIGHGVLDLAGFVPGFGELADLGNAAWYAVQGRGDEAALSAASAIPFLGWGTGAVKVGKWSRKLVKAGEEGAEAATAAAKFGKAVRMDYRKTFYEAHPELKGKVEVHHAVEQKAMTRYPNAGITREEMHSLENLRGIPKEYSADLHQGALRKDWNRFYKENPNATKEQLLEYATKMDEKYGHMFEPKAG